MRVRILIQAGAFDNRMRDPLRLLAPPKDLLNDILYGMKHDFKIKRVHKCGDGSVHLIEWESVSNDSINK